MNESVFIFAPKGITHIDMANNFQTNIYHHIFTFLKLVANITQYSLRLLMK